MGQSGGYPLISHCARGRRVGGAQAGDPRQRTTRESPCAIRTATSSDRAACPRLTYRRRAALTGGRQSARQLELESLDGVFAEVTPLDFLLERHFPALLAQRSTGSREDEARR